MYLDFCAFHEIMVTLRERELLISLICFKQSFSCEVSSPFHGVNVNHLPSTRIYGCYDIQPCICFPQHLLEEGHEGEVRQWHELLCLPVNNVPCHTDSICYCYGRPPNVGCWLAKGSCGSWPQCSLVSKKLMVYTFAS